MEDIGFDLFFKEESSKEINSQNILDELRVILTKVHDHPEKRKPEPEYGGERIRIACPFCGDSERTASKKRGIIYLNTSTYKCWNGGCPKPWMPLKSFFEEFDSELAVYIKEFTLEGFVSQNRSSNVAMSIFDVYDIKDKLVPRDVLMKKMGLVEVFADQEIKQYVQSRKLDIYDTRLAGNPRNKDLIFFNMTTTEKVLGLQIRKYKLEDKSKPRFLSFSYQDIYERILKQEVPEGADKVKRISMLYNILRVDLRNNLNIFESSVNSHHFPNSLASWGTGSIIKIDDAHYYLDDDTAGRKIGSELLKEGRRVFLWTKFKKLNPFYSSCTDINDLFKKGMRTTDGLDAFLSSSKLDICNL